MSYSVRVNGIDGVLQKLSAIDADGAIFGGTAVRVTTGELLYAPFVSSGTRPHDIYPRNKRVLAWAAAGVPTRLTGKPTKAASRSLGASAFVFSMHVHHPGTKPNRYVENAVAAATEGIILKVSEAVTALLGGAGHGALAKGLEQGGLLLQALIMKDAPVKTGTLRRAWHTEVVS